MALVLRQNPSHLLRHPNQLSTRPCNRAEVGAGKIVSSVKDGPIDTSKKPRHPEYKDLNFRLFSFIGWNYESVQSSRILAGNGFFYTGKGDLVRCYSCSIGFKDFISTDDIVIEHARYSPDCPVVINILGEPTFPQKKTDVACGMPQTNEKEQKNNYHSAAQNQRLRNQTATVVHSSYQSYTVRLNSYTNWPSDKKQKPPQLAEAGFYYTGRDDIVRCYNCDGGLRNWDPLDDPWIEHARHFPHCSFVKQTKGEQYITLVQSHYETLIKPDLTGFPKSGAAICSTQDKQQSSSKRFRAPPKINVKQQLLMMGYSESVIDRALVRLTEAEDDIHVSVEVAVDEIERLREAERTNNYPITESVPTTEPAEEYNQLKYKLNCKLCQEVLSDVLFLPCQHHCCCFACSQKISFCPLCGEYVQQKFKTFS